MVLPTLFCFKSSFGIYDLDSVTALLNKGLDYSLQTLVFPVALLKANEFYNFWFMTKSWIG